MYAAYFGLRKCSPEFRSENEAQLWVDAMGPRMAVHYTVREVK